MMKYTKYMLLFLPLLASCSQDDETENIENERIALAASVVEIGDAVTRAATDPTTYKGTPTETNQLAADIWFSTTSGSYPGSATGSGVGTDGSVDTHRTITYKSDGLTYPSDYNGVSLRYPTSKTIYCVGLYPQGKWTTTDGATVTATIDGNTDLMFAPEIYATSDSKFSTSNTQAYTHKLTWLKVRVRAENDETAYTWGALKSITVKGNDKATIDLSSGTISFSNSGDADKEFTLFDNSDGYNLEITSKEIGSILLAPVTAKDGDTEFTLHVTCEKDVKTEGGVTTYGRDVKVNLANTDGSSYSGDTAGKVFVVTLYFKTRPYIHGSVSLVDWGEEYRSLILQ